MKDEKAVGGFRLALLVQKAKSGNNEAFAELMETCKRDMYRTAAAILNNDDDAADAMQEAYLACFLNISKLEKVQYFKTWLIRIVINKSYDILRGRREHINLDEISETYADDTDEFEKLDEFSNSILHSIDANYSLILSLHYVSGYSVKEISRITSLNENTVKTRLSRGRDRLKTAVEERSRNNG